MDKLLPSAKVFNEYRVMSHDLHRELASRRSPGPMYKVHVCMDRNNNSAGKIKGEGICVFKDSWCRNIRPEALTSIVINSFEHIMIGNLQGNVKHLLDPYQPILL